VRRLLVGVFDPGGRVDDTRLARALAPYDATLVDGGSLRLAFTGPAVGVGEPLCLFDGFLDNRAELAQALREPADTDSERLLGAGYRRWGRDLPRRLRGDFALLVWDAQHGEGLIARDQLGVRGMYLSDAGAGVRFASEIHHLLALMPKRPSPDAASVAHWIAVSNRPGAATLYEGVRRLDPGAVLLLDRHGIREEQYWAPRFVEPLELPAAELALEVRAALDRAVERRIDPYGQTGVLMSGGLDSSTVAAVAAARAPGRVGAYSAVFPEHPAVDESALVDRLRSALGLSGLTAEVRPGGLVASAMAAAATWQAPLASWGDFWAVPLLRAAASAGVTTMLGGDGGDELFGARAGVLADRLRAGRPLQAIRLARELPGAGDRPPRRAMARVIREWGLGGALPYFLHEAARRPLAARSAPAWMRPQAVRDLIETDDPLAWKRSSGPRWWAAAVHALTRGFEEAGVFEAYRRRSTSAGLESRHPLFDLDLLELGLRQPPLRTLDPHLDRPVLRSCMEGVLPDAVRLRSRKALFDSLLVDSLTGPDCAAVYALLLAPGAALGAYVDLDGVRRALLADAASSATPFQWMSQLWRLVTLECWLRAQGGAPVNVLAAPSPSRIEIRRCPAPVGADTALRSA
jgi:asparagine synthase (glutamine-hydrolysing)